MRLAAIVLSGLLLSACAAGASSSPASLPPATPTPEAATPSAVPSTPSPVPTPDEPPPLFQNSGLASVQVDGLAVRTEPSSSAPQLEVDGAPAHRDAGDRLFVLGGPVAADGYWWFEVALGTDAARVQPIPVGWVAAGTESDPWIVAGRGDCPEPDLAALSSLSGILRAGCYDSAPLTFTARQAALPPDGGLGGACETDPARPSWLMCDNINYSWVNADGGTDWDLLLHFDPARGIPETELAPVGSVGPPYRITGHFDDPAATGCVTVADASSAEGLSQWLTCAAMFVVDELELVG